MAKHAIYIKFASEVNFESLKFTSHIITYEEIIGHLQERKNIKVAPDKDQIELYDALRNTKYEERDSIDPGARIIIRRYPGTKSSEIYAKKNAIMIPGIDVPIQVIKRGKRLTNADTILKEDTKVNEKDIGMLIGNQLDSDEEQIIDKKNRIQSEGSEINENTVLKLTFNIPQNILYERTVKDANQMKDQIVLQSPLKQIPEEALCDLCKNLNIKPYILTCCSRSICKICKVTTFDINQAPTCIFCNTNKFKIEPNIQGYLCIKSIFDLKEVQPLKNDEESINKVLIWKELNSIYFSKLKQINSENLIKEQDRNMFLMKWLKQFISSSFYVLKFSNVKEKFETSNEIVCTYPQPVVENKDQTKQEEKPSPPQVKFKLTKNLFSINKNLDEAEPLFTDESSRQFLIITEESQKLYGVVSLGKETRKDSKKDKDGDKNDKLRSFKCNWKVVCDLSQDLDFIEDFTKASPKQAINLIISMLKDEIEENKQNCENPGDGFYKYAVSNLIDSNSWISTIVSSVGKLRTSGRSDNRGAYDERSEAGQGSSELTLQKKASKNEETSFYEDIQMKSKPSSSKDAKGENKSGKKSSNKNESKDRVNDRDSDSYSDNKRSSYNNRNKGKKRRRSRDSRSRSNERRSRERRRSRDRKDKDDRKHGRDSNYKRENEKKRDERSPRRDRQANRDSKERQRNKDQKDKRRERDRGSDEQNSKPNKNKTDGRSDRSKSRDNGRENKDNKDNKDSKDNKDNKDSKESPRRDRRSNERKRDKKEERKANNE